MDDSRTCTEQPMPTQGPRIGQTVLYKLSEGDAATINARRGDTTASQDAPLILEITARSGWRSDSRAVSFPLAHATGQSVADRYFSSTVGVLHAGDVYPFIVTRVRENGRIDGLGFAGPGSLWVSSVPQGEDERQWQVA